MPVPPLSLRYRQQTLFWLMLAVTFVMPIAYHAGTGEVHAHTIFQSMIDGDSRHHHHDHDGSDVHRESPVSAFGALTVPLSSSAMSHETDNPDLPQLVGMVSPLLAAAPILGLGVTIAMLIAGRAISPITACCRRPCAWDPAADVPPPRTWTTPNQLFT